MVARIGQSGIRWSPPHLAALLILVAAELGCPNEERWTREVAARQPLWTAETAWTVLAEPTLVLGMPGSEPEAQFHDVRGAITLSDGTIVIAEASTDQLVVFSSEGKFLTTIGRRGRGPGEFRDPNDLFLLPGDTIAVRDLSTSRITLFLADGDLVGTSRIEGPLRQVPGLLTGHRLVAFRDIPGFGTGLLRGRPFYVSVLDFSGQEFASVGPFEGRSMYQVQRGNLNLSLDLIFESRTHVAANQDRFAVGNSGADSVMVYDVNADPLLVIRLPLEARSVEEEDVEGYLERKAPPGASRIDAAWREAHLQMIKEVPIPDLLPRFADLRIDPDGNLWVQAYPGVAALDCSGAVFGGGAGPVVRRCRRRAGETHIR